MAGLSMALPKIKVEHVALVVLGAAAGVFLWQGMKRAGGLPMPATEGTTESQYTIPEPVQPVLCMPDEHLGQMVFSKHRYPDRVGGSVTTVIHYGHSALAVPNEADALWITNPPAEASL